VRILVAEDDRPVANFLRKGLEAEHYAVDLAADGEQAQSLAEQYDYDLVVLDVGLPLADGFVVMRRIRALKRDLPVLMLTARSRVEDRIEGLDQGADDYMQKPFSFAELSARVRALLRRASRRTDDLILRVLDLEMILAARTVRRAGQRIELTSKEFALLEFLMRNAGRPVTRAMIIEHVWDISFDTTTNVVDVYVNYVRKKVDAGFTPKLIRTIRGVGYQLGATQGDEELLPSAAAK